MNHVWLRLRLRLRRLRGFGGLDILGSLKTVTERLEAIKALENLNYQNA
jgi:hypothetical protein